MIETILLATKFTAKAPAAREVAIQLSTGLGARLYVLSVCETAVFQSGEFDQQEVAEKAAQTIRNRVQAQLEEFVAPMVAAGVRPEKLLREGEAERAIIEAARDVKADLIIVGAGTRKGLVLDRFLRNVADKVRKRAECHVLTIV